MLLIDQAVITVSDQTTAKIISRILQRNFQLQANSVHKNRILRRNIVSALAASFISEE